MKILMIGNFEVSYTTENDWKYSYEQAGHTVIPKQEQRATTDDILEAVKKQKVDLVHYVHTHGWVTPGSFDISELLKRIKKLKVPIVSVHLDYWRGLDREKDKQIIPVWVVTKPK